MIDETFGDQEINRFLEGDFFIHLFDEFFHRTNSSLARDLPTDIPAERDLRERKCAILDHLGISTITLYAFIDQFETLHITEVNRFFAECGKPMGECPCDDPFECPMDEEEEEE